MIPASKHLDPLVGIDIHVIQPPGPVPPVPIPHPYIGIVCDPMDYLPFIGATVYVSKLPRTQAGTAGLQIPPSHVPIGGVWVAPPMNEGESFMGSSTVSVDGDAATYLALPALTCHTVGMIAPPRVKAKKTKGCVLPTTVNTAIPVGVNIGGSPTISLMALGFRVGLAVAGKALGAIASRFRKADGLAAGARRIDAPNGHKCNGGHPVNIVTGEVFDRFLDARTSPTSLFRWERYYSTARRFVRSSFGPGFSHCWDERIEIHRLGLRYVNWKGESRVFPLLSAETPSSAIHGLVLRYHGRDRYTLQRGNDPLKVFQVSGERPDVARLVEARLDDDLLRFQYRGDRLESIEESTAGLPGTTYTLRYGHRGLVSEIARRTAEREAIIATYRYDSSGRLVLTRNAHGGEHAFEYDESGLLTLMHDPRGYCFSWEYDDDGRCTYTTGEDGLWEERFEYFPEERETHVLRRGGARFVYRYDEHGILIEKRDPCGGSLIRTVDSVTGRVVHETDGGGKIMRWLYDEDGLHYARVDDMGYMYPPEIESGDPHDPLAPWAPTTALGWTLGVDTPAPNDPKWNAEIRADLERVRAATPAPVEPHNRYNGLGQIVESIDRAGRRRTFEYDRAGNEIVYVDPDGQRHETRTARWNLVGAAIDPLGNSTCYEYNPSERVTRIVDPGGTTSDYTYDAKDRLDSVSRGGVLREHYVYDEDDRMIEKQDGNGAVLLALEYDERSFPKKRRLASGELHELAYHRSGKPVLASTDSHDVRLERRADGAILTDRVDGVGFERTRTNGAEVLRLFDRFEVQVRDREDGCREFVDPTGGRHELRISADGICVRQHASGSIEVSHYDDEGRLKHQVRTKQTGDGAKIRQEVSYQYSGAGDLLSVHDSMRGDVRFGYDAAHRLIAERSDRTQVEYRYDAASNLIAKPGLSGVTLNGNRLQYANEAAFTYDDRHHISIVERSEERTRFVYDSLDMLRFVDDGHADGFWSAEYDALGRRLSAGRPNHQRRFFWEEDRLAAEIAPDGACRVYLYPTASARVPWMFVDFDSIDADPASGRTYVLFTDQVGCPTHVEDSSGHIVWSAQRVDAYGQIRVDESSEIELNLRWPGHYYDADTGLHYNRYRYYDPRLGRYLQSDPLGTAGNVNIYAYAPRPNVAVDVLGLAHDDVVSDAAGAGRRGDVRHGEGCGHARRRVDPQSPEGVRNARSYPARTADASAQAARVARAAEDIPRKRGQVIHVYTHGDPGGPVRSVSAGISGDVTPEELATMQRRLDADGGPPVTVRTDVDPDLDRSLIHNDNGVSTAPDNCAEPRAASAAHGNPDPINGSETVWRQEAANVGSPGTELEFAL